MVNLYTSGQYVANNPTLHEEDSLWKVQKIMPFFDHVFQKMAKQEISILDVGGGAGIVLCEIASTIRRRYKKQVNKYCLDLSPEMLAIQNKNNPDAMAFYHQDISQTTLPGKSIDLVLMVDVLEHVPHPEIALREIKRIARYAIFKVPLEDNLILKLLNIVTLGNFKKQKTENTLGHVNCYDENSLKKEITRAEGKIIKFNFTNVFEYLLKNPYYKTRNTFIHQVVFLLAKTIYKFSPPLAAKIFNDFAVCLVEFD